MGAGVVKSQDSGGTRRRRRAHRHPAAMSEINVTPFVDVMLVLLVIFMVAAPLMTAGVPINLPKTAATAVPSEPEEPLVISIPAEGAITLMNTPVDDQDVVGRLRAVLEERQSDKIFLRADGGIPYSRVVQVMGALNAAGYTNIVLVTDTGGPRLDR